MKPTNLSAFCVFCLIVFCHNGFSQTFNCTLNTAFDKKNLPVSEASKYIKSFTYNSDKEVGKNIELSPYKLLLWKKDADLNVKFIGKEFKKSLSIQFDLKQPKLRFHYGTHLDFVCNQKGETELQKALKLDNKKEISFFQEKIKILVSKDLTFRYLQEEENQMMRTVFFQNGKVFYSSQEMEQRMPWCSLRVQLKRNENTDVKKGESFKPINFQKQENNTYFTTFSYSFVDFSKGKIEGEQRLYKPFMFRCNVLRGMPYKMDTFKSMVGDYLSLQATL